MDKENKIRSKNFTKDEKLRLVHEISLYQYIIENKATNMTTNKDKEEAWANVTMNFNRNKPETQQRTEKCLRLCWDNLKRDTKKYCAKLQRELYKTGGGVQSVQPNPLLEQVREMMTKAAVSGLHNPFDSDAITINENAHVQELLEDNDSCDDPVEVFTYLLKNENIKNWQGCSIKNLRSEISPPLKKGLPLQESSSSNNSIPSQKSLPLNENMVTLTEERCKKRSYQESCDLEKAKIDLTNTLKSSIEVKNIYEVEILKQKLEQEQLKVKLLKMSVRKETLTEET
ncbi:PREDICTED: uncharacterized protein LOC105555834 [Vollenhovia emeryi]|uniref:uncharacterized protein LOC105555834 n=1 Tax=Vollenhovia emeryi TaxID=411798 RepID=UPI0005F47F72|nr:PREDICTED: uncharacterized protein LOC105555834 [Vollenhovia emeryi]